VDQSLVWGIVGAVAGVIAIPTSIIIYIKQQARAHLDYRIVTKTKLLAAPSSGVQVTAGGRPLHNASLIAIEVINTGKRPIKADDYSNPITFLFPGVFMASVEVAREDPPRCSEPGPETAERDKATCRPNLLNTGDRFTLNFIVDGSVHAVKVASRFEGETRRMSNITSSRGRRWGVVGGFIGGLAGVVTVTLLLNALDTPSNQLEMGISIITACLALLALLAGGLGLNSAKRRRSMTSRSMYYSDDL